MERRQLGRLKTIKGKRSPLRLCGQENAHLSIKKQNGRLNRLKTPQRAIEPVLKVPRWQGRAESRKLLEVTGLAKVLVDAVGQGLEIGRVNEESACKIGGAITVLIYLLGIEKAIEHNADIVRLDSEKVDLLRNHIGCSALNVNVDAWHKTSFREGKTISIF